MSCIDVDITYLYFMSLEYIEVRYMYLIFQNIFLIHILFFDLLCLAPTTHLNHSLHNSYVFNLSGIHLNVLPAQAQRISGNHFFQTQITALVQQLPINVHIMFFLHQISLPPEVYMFTNS